MNADRREKSFSKKISAVFCLVALGLICSFAWGDILNDVSNLFGRGHIARKYGEFKENFAPTSIAWSPDGRFIASTGMHTQTINIWDVEKKKINHSVELTVPNTPSFHGLAWSPDGHYLASCTGMGSLSLRIWDTRTWTIVKDFNNKKDDIAGCNSLAFTHDNQRLAVGQERQVTILSTSTWQAQRVWRIPGNIGRDIAVIEISPDDSTLAIAENGYWAHRSEGHVVFWNLDDEQPSDGFKAYRSDVISLAYQPDGKRLATGTTTGSSLGEGSRRFVEESVHIWNLNDGTLFGAPLDDGHAGAVYALAYTADGRYLIAGHQERGGTIDLINPVSSTIVDTVRAPDSVRDIAVRSDSSMFAVSSRRSIAIWSLTKNN